jgi:hypothetical protein
MRAWLLIYEMSGCDTHRRQLRHARGHCVTLVATACVRRTLNQADVTVLHACAAAAQPPHVLRLQLDVAHLHELRRVLLERELRRLTQVHGHDPRRLATLHDPRRRVLLCTHTRPLPKPAATNWALVLPSGHRWWRRPVQARRGRRRRRLHVAARAALPLLVCPALLPTYEPTAARTACPHSSAVGIHAPSRRHSSGTSASFSLAQTPSTAP